MGGHGVLRGSESYVQAVEISRRLTRDGYLMVSGGGPGAMEATHVGAWFADKDDQSLADAIDILRQAPKYSDREWLSTAFKVLNKYPNCQHKSVGIPTWHYGHEPPTPFATEIAKYFDNSVREEGLLAIAKGGIVFTPGSAGTIQKIFQDLAQNHYKSYGIASPMVFLNKEYWCYQRPLYPVIELMHLRSDLGNLNLGIYDSVEDVMSHIKEFRAL
jgi:predicted Rossmann-fold nucleotide-binding protein